MDINKRRRHTLQVSSRFNETNQQPLQQMTKDCMRRQHCNRQQACQYEQPNVLTRRTRYEFVRRTMIIQSNIMT